MEIRCGFLTFAVCITVLLLPIRATAADTSIALPTVSATPGSVVIVPIALTATGAFGGDLVFIANSTVLAPAAEFVKSNAFQAIAGSQLDWEVIGDTVFISMAGSQPVSLTNETLVELAFIVAPGLSSGTTVALRWVTGSNINERPTNLVDGTFTVSAPTAIADVTQSDAFHLYQNAPNPFNPETVIRYGLPATGHVDLSIYDVTGRLVRTLVSDEMIAGAHEVVWNATDGAGRSVASGVYVYRLTSAQGTVVRRMTLVR